MKIYVYASEQSERARKFWHFYILNVLFLSIFCRYKWYVWGIILAFLHTKSAISFNILSVQIIFCRYKWNACRLTCTDKFPDVPTKLRKSIIGGGGGVAPLPPSGYASAWDLHVPFTCIIGSPAILFLAIMLHNVCLFYTFLYINDVKKRIHVLANPQRSSLRLHLCASERSERAIFGVCNSFTVKKVSFFTINVKFKVILSSKSGGMFVQAIPPHPKKWGGGGYIPPPIPPPPRDLRQWVGPTRQPMGAAKPPKQQPKYKKLK